MPPQCSRKLQQESSRQVNLDSPVVPIDATNCDAVPLVLPPQILAATPLYRTSKHEVGIKKNDK
jgi:hypothetical protein